METTIMELNNGCYGSTGKIMIGIAKAAESEDYQVHLACPDNRKYRVKNLLANWKNKYRISGVINMKISNDITRLTGLDGCLNFFHTVGLCRYISKYNVKLIHLHNLHSGYINLPVLFHFIKKNNLAVIWTLHDCWTFTGHCPHFAYRNCEKWKTGCHHCDAYNEYPRSLYDNSSVLWKLKRKIFTGVQNVTIVTPSKWLADKVNESFLNHYNIRTINNGIDLSVFKPSINHVREQYGIGSEKIIVLGVSFGWSKKKGLDVFVELSHRLDANIFQIVLVGTDDKTDKELPSNIISIHCTQNQDELAQIYTSANVFVNPTREDTFPTVNIEALACGVPVITFKTGGSPEIIDEKTGVVIEQDDIDMLEQTITHIGYDNHFKRSDCIERAKQFDMASRFQEYVELYRSVLS